MDIGKTLEVRDRLEWRRWLAKHHADTKEIWLVYYKKGSGRPGISYEESVLEGVAYGWVDGQNKSIDEQRYAARFTPRRPKSNWSASNIARARKLLAEGLMAEPGLASLPPALAVTRWRDRAAGNSLPRLRGRVRLGAK